MLSMQYHPSTRNFKIHDSNSRTGRPAFVTRAKLESYIPECVPMIDEAFHAPSQMFEIPNTVRPAHIGR